MLLKEDGRKPSELKVAELKLWLVHRHAPTKGKKSDLIARSVIFLAKLGSYINISDDHTYTQSQHSRCVTMIVGRKLLAT